MYFVSCTCIDIILRLLIQYKDVAYTFYNIHMQTQQSKYKCVFGCLVQLKLSIEDGGLRMGIFSVLLCIVVTHIV